MPVSDDAALRGLVERLLGWDNSRAVELAYRSVELAAEHRAELVLCGAGDMVPIASALHRRALGTERPFMVCDSRRGDTPASVRSPANRASGVAALAAAVGGSLCMRTGRLPRDFSALVARLRDTRDVTLMVCAGLSAALDPLVIRPAPINVPPLAGRAAELDRVIAEYAADAIAELSAPPGSFTERDHAWVREHAATLAEVEKATLRLVALRTSRNPSTAATRLGMAGVSLSRWVDRRGLRRVLATTGGSPCRPT
ncbi:MAG TPA: hypothetical protein VF469_06260 [Kofleriaceae bacterium]